MKAKLIGMSAYQGTPTSGTLRIYRAGRYEDGQGNAAVRLEEFKWRAGTAGARGSWGDPFNPAVDAYTVVSAAGEPAPVEGLFEEVFVYADGSERRSLYRKNLIATNLAGTEFDYTEPQGVTTYSGSEPLTFQAARDLLTEGTTKLAEMEQALADNAQTQAEMGLTAVPNEAALTGKTVGGYRVISTNERVYWSGTAITARAPLAAADALAARVYRVPLIPGGTAAQNAAIASAVHAAAPDGSRIEYPRDGLTYDIGSVDHIPGKTLVVDLTGTRLIWHSEGPLGRPFLHMAGTQGASLTLTACTEGSRTVTLATAGDAAALSVGMWVRLGDKYTTWAWDNPDGTVPAGRAGVGSSSYTDRYEWTQITAISGATITLAKPIEWSYSVTPYLIPSPTPLNSPQVIGGAGTLIREVDPGGGARVGPLVGTQAPHIIHIERAVTPRVEGITLDGWQMHAVCIHESYDPFVAQINGTRPFRPQFGGMGYLVRLDRVTRGHVWKSTSLGVRHHVDYVQCYDSGSSENTAQDNANTAYLLHGLGSKRCYSTDDAATGVVGWGAGNTAFSADYGYKITRPKYTGTGLPYVFIATAEDMEVIDPEFTTSQRGGLMADGAQRLILRGGTVDTRRSTDQFGGAGLLVRNKYLLASTYPLPPGDVTVEGTKFLNTDGYGNGMLIGSAGRVSVRNVEFTGGNYQLQLNDTAPSEVEVIGTIHKGGYFAPYYSTVEPTGRHLVDGLKELGTPSVSSVKIVLNARTTIRGSRLTQALSTPSGMSVTQALDAGAVITDNTPNTNDRIPANASWLAQFLSGIQVKLAGLVMSRAAGSNTDLTFQIDGLARWIVRHGSGGDLEIMRRSAAGGVLDSPIYLPWASGAIVLNAAWDKPINAGGTRLWTDAAGRLRIKNLAAPTSDTDGRVVGLKKLTGTTSGTIGTTITVAHGLGYAPTDVMVSSRGAGAVYYTAVDATNVTVAATAASIPFDLYVG
ncbi:hypothetical protein CBQ26_09070 [Deinococcus indicus]|uniref:Uncharacterized protein n=1 Tax=Deinococcus indicus TaxID=223556 RepID=A0A2D0A7X7_9DEIO|nr:hypothetical protein [Deinococcus indicus]OWL96517.1 hypothetical protein CBQ26_09070 [Deinococcus indicus]